MTVLVVTPPEPLVAIDTVMDHLRNPEGEDDLIEGYLAAATSWIDNPLGWLGRAFRTQTLELRVRTFDCLSDMPHGPISEVESVQYVSPSGAVQTLPAEAFRLEGAALASAAAWPALRGDSEGVRVRYVVGAEDAPPAVQQAALLLIGQWFRNRMAVNVGNVANELPFGVEALLHPYRRFA